MKKGNYGGDQSSEDDDQWEPEAAGGDDFEGESVNLSIGSVKSKRGRKPLKEQWTRVISLDKDDLSNLRTFELAPDLLLANAMKATTTRGKKQ